MQVIIGDTFVTKDLQSLGVDINDPEQCNVFVDYTTVEGVERILTTIVVRSDVSCNEGIALTWAYTLKDCKNTLAWYAYKTNFKENDILVGTLKPYKECLKEVEAFLHSGTETLPPIEIKIALPRIAFNSHKHFLEIDYNGETFKRITAVQNESGDMVYIYIGNTTKRKLIEIVKVLTPVTK